MFSRSSRLRLAGQGRRPAAARLRAAAPPADRTGPVLRNSVHRHHRGRAHGWLCRHFCAHDGAGHVPGAPLQAAVRCHPGATACSRGDAKSASTIIVDAANHNQGRHGGDPKKVPGAGAAAQAGRTRPVELTSKRATTVVGDFKLAGLAERSSFRDLASLYSRRVP
jgi:hypothetical protein